MLKEIDIMGFVEKTSILYRAILGETFTITDDLSEYSDMIHQAGLTVGIENLDNGVSQITFNP